MNVKLLAAAGVLALAIAGCGPGVDTRTPILVRAFPDGAWPSEPGWNVSIQFGGTEFQDCRSLSRATQADVNGQPMQILALGGRPTSTLGVPDGACEGAWFEGQGVEASDDEDELLVLDGSERVLDMRVQALLEPRSIALMDHLNGVLHAGDDVELAWSPPTDALTFADLNGVSPGIAFLSGEGDKGAANYLSITEVADGHVKLHIDGGKGGAVQGQLVFMPAISPKVQRCQGDYRNCVTEVRVRNFPSVNVIIQ